MDLHPGLEISFSLICLAFQDLRSLRDSQVAMALPTSAFQPVLKYQTRSKINVHMKNSSMAISQRTFPPISMKRGDSLVSTI